MASALVTVHAEWGMGDGVAALPEVTAESPELECCQLQSGVGGRPVILLSGPFLGPQTVTESPQTVTASR